MMKFRFFLVCLLPLAYGFSFSNHIDSTKRKVHSFYNCSDSNVDIIYTRADGKNDTLHYISSAIGLPSLLILRTNINKSCNVDCAAFSTQNITGKHVKCDEEPKYAFSISFSKIYEYDDPEDTADMHGKKVKDWNVIDMRSLTFNNITKTSDLSKNTFTWKVTEGNNDTLQFMKDGSISFGIEIYDMEGRNEHLPHLLYNGNGSHIFFTIDKVKPSYVHSRFALELEMVVVDKHMNSKTTDIHIRKSLDDEHTPGVFDVITWSAKADTDELSAFTQWKPVCYIDPKPSIQHSTMVKNYTVLQQTLDKGDFSLPLAYFGADVNVSATNVSFGLSKDKFYNSANYVKWTFAIGYGTPPQDEISALIITIISVGLGIPILLMVFGSICACVKRRKAAKESEFSSSYTAIQ